MAPKKGMTTIYFRPLSFIAIFWIRDPKSGIRDPGSEIRDPRSGIRDPGWVNIRIRDKHPGSATLEYLKYFKGFVSFKRHLELDLWDDVEDLMPAGLGEVGQQRRQRTLAQGQEPPISKYYRQCCGSGSESGSGSTGSTCFWAYWIRIRIN